MKARRLVLCLFLSLALIVTFIPITSFADDGDDDEYSSFDSKFTDFDQIVDSAQAISVGQTKTVTNESMFEFKPTVSGYYVFFSTITSDPKADPIGQVLDEWGDKITSNDDYSENNPNFRVCFWGEAYETYYLQARNFEEIAAVFGVSLAKDVLVTGFSYTPKGAHPSSFACDYVIDNDDYWPQPDFAIGDIITLYYENNTSKDFVYATKPDPWNPGSSVEAFVNKENTKEDIPGRVSLWADSEFPASTYKLGNTVNVNAVAYFEDEYHGYDEISEEDTALSASTKITVKFAISHSRSEMKKTNAISATCSTPGNIEYYYCPNCQKFFSDLYGQNEIAVGGWIIPAGHKWQHVKKAAGLMKNGVQYDQCTVCGAKQNSSVIPGWSKYYVKAPKTVAGKKSFTVKWGKQSKANLKKFNGYQIRYSTKKSMAKSKMVKAGKTAKLKKVSGLKGKTKYFVQVRTYAKKGGKTFYSKWSAKKTVKTK